MRYTMWVVEIDGALEHELPADTVTRDTPPLAPSRGVTSERGAAAAGSGNGTRGPLVPLAFRPRHDVFYVSAARWPELTGKALRVKPPE
ncbi:MAG TPA: hypothetical protein VF904_04535 [Anaeromyxobacteraceae bacterium]